jgi:hypothetical protein
MSDPYTNRKLKDSGERQEFGTGAVRDAQTEKGRYDLLPPAAIFAVARVFEEGAKKYAARNFEKGIPLSRYIDSGLRHIFKHLEGHRDEPHMAQAAWNLLAYIHTATMIERGVLPDSLNDLPNHLGKEKPTVLGVRQTTVPTQGTNECKPPPPPPGPPNQVFIEGEKPNFEAPHHATCSCDECVAVRVDGD